MLSPSQAAAAPLVDTSLALADALAAVVDAPTALQGPPTDVPQVDTSTGLGGGASGAFLTTLILGAILVAFAPDYTRGRMADVVDDPVGSFAYGVVALVGLIALAFALVITIVGILFVVPLILLAILIWSAGAAVGFLAIADRLLGGDRVRRDRWIVPLLVAALLNGALALTGIGGIVSFCVGAAGFGAIMRAELG